MSLAIKSKPLLHPSLKTKFEGNTNIENRHISKKSVPHSPIVDIFDLHRSYSLALAQGDVHIGTLETLTKMCS